MGELRDLKAQKQFETAGADGDKTNKTSFIDI